MFRNVANWTIVLDDPIATVGKSLDVGYVSAFIELLDDCLDAPVKIKAVHIPTKGLDSCVRLVHEKGVDGFGTVPTTDLQK
jgi:hypothetical protein